MDQKQETIVSITDNAAEKVKTLLAQEGEEDLALRIGVRPGGCSGFQYSIYFDDEVNDDDEVFETKGVRVLIEGVHIFIGILAAALIAAAAAWSYPRAADDIWLVASVCMGAVVLMGIGPVRRAYYGDGATSVRNPRDIANG